MTRRGSVADSELARRLCAGIADPEERRQFRVLLGAAELPEGALRVLSDLWVEVRRPGETLVAFLDWTGVTDPVAGTEELSSPVPVPVAVE
jgi:hypothetical protein